MAWARIEDGFFRHRKVAPLTPQAKLLFLAGLCRSVEQMADGFLDHHSVRIAAAEVNVKTNVADQLVHAGLWHKHADGYEIHDYLEYQPSAEDERARRSELSAKRAAAGRKGAASRWHKPSPDMANANSKTMANAIANASQTDGPIPKGSLSNSSSSELLSRGNPEEEEEMRAEAKRRLAARTANRGEVTNPDAWLDRCVSNLKAEGWTPPARPATRPPCDTCDSTGVVLNDDDTATACHACKASA